MSGAFGQAKKVSGVPEPQIKHNHVRFPAWCAAQHTSKAHNPDETTWLVLT